LLFLAGDLAYLIEEGKPFINVESQESRVKKASRAGRILPAGVGTCLEF
jgi:hypothetical protein